VSRTGARVLLFVGCLVAGAATFQSFRFSDSFSTGRVRQVDVEHEAGRLLVTLSDLRAAQMAYLATGQGPEFWMRRATELGDQLRDGLATLRASLTTAEAQSAVDVATVALGDLMQLDNRARTAINTEQRYFASDLVFADAVTGTQQIAEAIDTARRAEQTAINASLERDRVIQTALGPAALVLVLIAAWTAGNANRPKKTTPRSEAEELAQMLRELPPPVKAPGVPAVTTPPVAIPPSNPKTVPQNGAAVIDATPVETPAATATPAPEPPPTPTVDLAEAAELCVDLARVIDARDLPSLLQRAARAIEATGVIVWVVDTNGETLTPTLSHGYPDRVLARLGTLDVNADNVTSLSFRSMRPQSIPGAGRNGSSSAIAVPLVTADGCNGVLAAEVAGERPADESLALARILAAQLATMLSPLEPPARQAAEA
jgi:hypothetical protein